MPLPTTEAARDWQAALALLSEPGRIASGTDPEVKAESGSYLWVYPDSTDLQALNDLVEADLLRPVIAAEFPFGMPRRHIGSVCRDTLPERSR